MARPGAVDLLKVNAWIRWVRAIVSIWFVRIFWPVPFLWGAVDRLVRASGGIAGVDYAPTEDDVAIRTFTGGCLFLVWLFLARRQGPFTLNKNGILEVRPDRQNPRPTAKASPPS